MPQMYALTTAQSRFEAARKLDGLPSGLSARQLHGHGFIATVQASMPAHATPYPGAQASALLSRLSGCVQELDYSDLNLRLPYPDDINLAQWTRRKLALDETALVGIQSTPDKGVAVQPDGSQSVWRRYRFRAAHQLPNVAPGHKCGRMHGHGFQVILHAQCTEAADVAYDLLDSIWEPFRAQLDHRCLNHIEGLSNPTSEMLSAWLWHRIKPGFAALRWVTVYETASCGAQYDGERYQIWKDFSIDSAIRMSQAPLDDPRHMIHGDTFLLRLHLSADLDKLMGWTVDFGDVKTAFNPIFKMLDHRPLYEQQAFADGDAQAIARWTLETARINLPQLVRVDVIDSAGAGAMVFQGQQSASSGLHTDRNHLAASYLAPPLPA